MNNGGGKKKPYVKKDTKCVMDDAPAPVKFLSISHQDDAARYAMGPFPAQPCRYKDALESLKTALSNVTIADMIRYEQTTKQPSVALVMLLDNLQKMDAS
jgi:hypothetical protein